MDDNEVENKDSWCLIKMMVFNVKCVTVGFTVTVKISISAFNIMSEKMYLHWICMTCDLQVVTTVNLINIVNKENKLLRNYLILLKEIL